MLALADTCTDTFAEDDLVMSDIPLDFTAGSPFGIDKIGHDDAVGLHGVDPA